MRYVTYEDWGAIFTRAVEAGALDRDGLPALQEFGRVEPAVDCPHRDTGKPVWRGPRPMGGIPEASDPYHNGRPHNWIWMHYNGYYAETLDWVEDEEHPGKYEDCSIFEGVNLSSLTLTLIGSIFEGVNLTLTLTLIGSIFEGVDLSYPNPNPNWLHIRRCQERSARLLRKNVYCIKDTALTDWH